MFEYCKRNTHTITYMQQPHKSIKCRKLMSMHQHAPWTTEEMFTKDDKPDHECVMIWLNAKVHNVENLFNRVYNQIVWIPWEQYLAVIGIKSTCLQERMLKARAFSSSATDPVAIMFLGCSIHFLAVHVLRWICKLLSLSLHAFQREEKECATKVQEHYG